LFAGFFHFLFSYGETSIFPKFNPVLIDNLNDLPVSVNRKIHFIIARDYVSEWRTCLAVSKPEWNGEEFNVK